MAGIAIAAAALTAGAAPALGQNLVQNPSAEAGGAGGYPTVVPVGSPWSITAGEVAVQRYFSPGGPATESGFPTTAEAGRIGGGANLFFGGRHGISAAEQIITLDPSTHAGIDAGTTRARLAAHLGGYSTQEDAASVSAQYRGDAGQPLGSLGIGPVDRAARGGVTKLLLREASGAVPAGTRFVLVEMRFVRASGTANDGYADNVVFALIPPEDRCRLDEQTSRRRSAGYLTFMAVVTLFGHTQRQALRRIAKIEAAARRGAFTPRSRWRAILRERVEWNRILTQTRLHVLKFGDRSTGPATACWSIAHRKITRAALSEIGTELTANRLGIAETLLRVRNAPADRISRAAARRRARERVVVIRARTTRAAVREGQAVVASTRSADGAQAVVPLPSVRASTDLGTTWREHAMRNRAIPIDREFWRITAAGVRLSNPLTVWRLGLLVTAYRDNLRALHTRMRTATGLGDGALECRATILRHVNRQELRRGLYGRALVALRRRNARQYRAAVVAARSVGLGNLRLSMTVAACLRSKAGASGPFPGVS